MFTPDPVSAYGRESAGGPKRLILLGIHSRCEDSTKVVVCPSWTVTSDVIDDVFGSLAFNAMYFL